MTTPLNEPRRELCEWCWEWVEEWTDPDWSHGRVCAACAAKYEPKQPTNEGLVDQVLAAIAAEPEPRHGRADH